MNLATWLLIDAFDKAFDAAVVITNDSDVAEPIQEVRRKFGYRVMVLDSVLQAGSRPQHRPAAGDQRARRRHPLGNPGSSPCRRPSPR